MTPHAHHLQLALLLLVQQVLSPPLLVQASLYFQVALPVCIQDGTLVMVAVLLHLVQVILMRRMELIWYAYTSAMYRQLVAIAIHSALMLLLLLHQHVLHIFMIV